MTDFTIGQRVRVKPGPALANGVGLDGLVGGVILGFSGNGKKARLMLTLESGPENGSQMDYWAYQRDLVPA